MGGKSTETRLMCHCEGWVRRPGCRARSALPHPRLHRDLLGTHATRVRHPVDHLLERHLVLRGGDQFHGDRIGKILHDEVLFANSLQRFSPRAAASIVVSAWTTTEWSISRTSRNVTRHSRRAMGNSVSQWANKRRTYKKFSKCPPWTLID